MSAPHVHECAVEGCRRPLAHHLLMCVEHWRMVPAPVQREVVRAWREWRRWKSVDTVVALRSAQEKARSTVRDKLAARQAKLETVQGALDI